jgi:hypothetical protein
MRYAQVVGASALALALAAGFGGSAQAAGEGSAKRADFVPSQTATFAQAGDQVTVSCPDHLKLESGWLAATSGTGERTVYHVDPSEGVNNSWTVRVESTERTTPWNVTATAHCTSYPSPIRRSIAWVVEDSHTAANVGDEVRSTCPAESGGFAGGYVKDSGGAGYYHDTPEGSYSLIVRICEMPGTAPVRVFTRTSCW